jgi:hypothetical protein
VIALALVPGEDAARLLYELMPVEIATAAINAMHEVLGPRSDGSATRSGK